MKKRAMDFVIQYMIFWGMIAAVGVTLAMITGGVPNPITCINGSVVYDESICPDCLNDSHCGPNKLCKWNECEPKECISDTDCDTRTAMCLYGYCSEQGDGGTI